MIVLFSSPQSVARSVEEVASKLLMITEVKVGLRKRGLISVREGFLAASDRATGLPFAATVATAAAMINRVMLVRMIASIQ